MTLRSVRRYKDLLYSAGDQKAGTAAQQILADFLPGPVQIPANGRLRHVHDIRDVIDLTAFDITEDKCRFLLAVQAFGSLVQMLAQTAVAEVALGIIPMMFSRFADIIQRFMTVTAMFTHIVYRGVDGDSIQPGIESFILVVTPQVLRSLDKYILSDIGGLIIIADHLVSQSADLVSVAADQFAKGTLISLLHPSNDRLDLQFVLIVYIDF